MVLMMLHDLAFVQRLQSPKEHASLDDSAQMIAMHTWGMAAYELLLGGCLANWR